MPRPMPDRLVIASVPPLLLPGAGGREPAQAVAPLRATVGEAVRWLLDGATEVGVLGPRVDTVDPHTSYSLDEFGIPGHVGIPAGPDGPLVSNAPLATLAAAMLLQGCDVPVVPAAGARRLLVLGGGSARRRDGAPGYFDERAVPYDDRLAEILRAGDVAGAAGLDVSLGDELLADLPGVLAPLCRDLPQTAVPAVLDCYDAPYGVAYFVARWGS